MKKLVCLLLLLLLPPLCAAADSAPDTVYEVFNGKGKLVTRYCGECDVGDEYISGDNRHYRVQSVDSAAKTAVATELGQAEMPDVSWLDLDGAQPVSAAERKIALYCTHSDESYREGDGTQSSEKRGGIYDVAAKFASELEDLGATVERSEETHHPHDAGAYRRSRQTALTLLKAAPSAIFDLHRDGIPDPDEYNVTIGGTQMSKVRLLVGKGNQNREANLSFAKQIKAVGDKVYPGLIKDIYMGKGSYNQDLAPRSVLLEFGTHTVAKSRVLASAAPMAETVYKALFGGVTGAAGASDVSRGNASAQSSGAAQPSEAADTPAKDDNKGSGAIWWMIGALVIGLLIYALVSGGGMNKFKRSFSEMTGGLFGKKPR